MDFVEGLPNSRCKSLILVVVDCMSKYAHFLGLTHLFTANMVSREFHGRVDSLHVLPCTIVFDMLFMIKFW